MCRGGRATLHGSASPRQPGQWRCHRTRPWRDPAWTLRTIHSNRAQERRAQLREKGMVEGREEVKSWGSPGMLPAPGHVGLWP